MLSSRASSRSRAARSGFTLIELLVALTLLTIGLLPIVRGSGVVARAAGAGERRARTAALIGSRFERLRAAPCLTAAGADTDRLTVARWAVRPLGARTYELSDSASIADAASRARVEGARSAVRC